jgi:probable HAF family extracellular repeat protein
MTIGVVTPAALNDQAPVQVAGTSGTLAFRYTFSATPPMEDAGRNSPKSVTRGFGINSSGVVVGDSTFGPSTGLASRAASFSNGTATALGTLPNSGPFSRANGINASGQVVGFSGDRLDGDSSRAFLVKISSGLTHMIDLGTLGGSYAQAWAINDAGFVTGNSQTGGGDAPTHAFIWDITAKMRDLGTLGGKSSHGTSVNAQNHVVGNSAINIVDNRVHAFLYDGTLMNDLGSLGGASASSDRSYALGVNATDQVVGYTYLPPAGPIPHTDSTQVAFISQLGVMVDLNDLIGTASNNYRLYSATAINDRGQIVAVAFATSANGFHAVLLTPAP